MAKRKISEMNLDLGYGKATRGKRKQEKKRIPVSISRSKKPRSMPLDNTKTKNAVKRVGKEYKKEVKRRSGVLGRAVSKVSEKAMGKRGFANYAEVEARNKKMLKKNKQSNLIKKYQDLGKL